MVVSDYMGFPFMKHFQSGLRFGMLRGEPVSVKVKPVVICSSAWPVLSELPVVRGFNCCIVNMHVAPVCRPFETIRIEARIDKNNAVIQNTFNLLALCGRKMVSC